MVKEATVNHMAETVEKLMISAFVNEYVSFMDNKLHRWVWKFYVQTEIYMFSNAFDLCTYSKVLEFIIASLFMHWYNIEAQIYVWQILFVTYSKYSVDH